MVLHIFNNTKTIEIDDKLVNLYEEVVSPWHSQKQNT